MTALAGADRPVLLVPRVLSPAEVEAVCSGRLALAHPAASSWLRERARIQLGPDGEQSVRVVDAV
ncbi:hypothetical protein [Cellulomonas sp. Y8]|uniref:hypothetical protein n=1 Tax=Cellulomonas sp. Y8 TaxID=2591145 RepID=UPI003D749671